MRVVLVSCVFPPEPLTSASTSNSLARELVKRGCDTVVITSCPSRPGGRIFPNFRRSMFPRCERNDGLEVVRCFSLTSPRSTIVSRLAENLSFGLCAGLAMARVRRPDVIYANTWPICATGIACLIARIRRIPIVLSIQDVYPESLISLKKLGPDTRAARALRWLDSRIARIPCDLVVISESAGEIYSRNRGIAREKIHCIPNWIAAQSPPTEETAQRLRKQWEIGVGDFLIVFAGNIAAACGMERVISVVSRLGEESPVKFVIAGSGSALESCRSVSGRTKSGRVRFNGPFVVSETLAILSAADILILPTHGDQSLVSMPSKLTSYMMSGRPVLAIAHPESDLAKLIIRTGCGWVVETEDSEALVQQLEKVVALERSELTRMGSLGRRYALAHLTTEICMPKLVAVVEDAAHTVTK
jgi:colanic acid biosynthesis glycosyl transferase WcaI